jgi:hypothetical protein
MCYPRDKLAESSEFFRANKAAMKPRVFDGDGKVGREDFEFYYFGILCVGDVRRTFEPKTP